MATDDTQRSYYHQATLVLACLVWLGDGRSFRPVVSSLIYFKCCQCRAVRSDDSSGICRCCHKYNLRTPVDRTDCVVGIAWFGAVEEQGREPSPVVSFGLWSAHLNNTESIQP